MTHDADVSAWVAHAALSRSASQALDTFAAAGIPALCVKGVALGASRSKPRKMEDADLRIRWEQFEAAIACARAAGFGLRDVSRAYRSVVLVIDERMVDVECTIGPPGLCALSVAAMLDRAETAVLPGGHAVWVPELHDHALVLLVNAFKDKCTLTAPWVAEDLEHIVHAESFSAHTLAARAREASLATLVSCVAEWMAERDENGVWPALLAALEPDASAWYTRAFASARTRPTSLTTRIIARLGSDDLRERARALVHLAGYTLERVL